jgi:hydroxymethylbilane synthase
MRAGELQAAMHSLKDVPGNEETPGLVLAAMLARDAANDSLVLRPGLSLESFRALRGKSFKIGTNAVRRAAYLRRLFPEATVIHYRGAADTRVAKLDRGDMQRLPGGGEVGPADALVMARSGLERIGMTSRVAHDFSVGEMLPAVGQGIVAVECVEKDWVTRGYLAKIENMPSRFRAEAEREVLWVLNGHCNSPIAGHATLDGSEMTLTAAVLDEATGTFIEASRHGAADRPRELGRAVGLDLLDKGAAELIARNRPDEH